MKFLFFIFFFLILLVGTLAVVPLATATCSLGGSPVEMSANAKPGQTVEVVWNFFNLRGDRLTHVLVGQGEGPAWDVSYEPEAEIKSYEVSGLVKESEENFAMAKSPLVSEKPDPLPSGIVAYIVHPDSSQGYILVDKQLKIFITLPDDAVIGEQQEFTFESIGKCFGETGAVAASLATELKVKITPTTDYYERELDTDVSRENIGKKITNFFGGEESKMTSGTMIATGTTLILVIIFIVMIVMMMKKKQKRKKKSSVSKKGKTK